MILILRYPYFKKIFFPDFFGLKFLIGYFQKKFFPDFFGLKFLIGYFQKNFSGIFLY